MVNNNNTKNLNVPNLRFPEFKGEWKKCKLLEVCSFFSGGTPSSKKEYYDGNIPFIRSGELHKAQTELFITEDGLKNSAAKMVEVGDLLLALYGATSGDIAISKINGAINQAILCVRTEQNKKFIESIWYKHVGKLLHTYLQGGQGNLSADIVKNISFYFARIEEQKKLAKFISKLDERIATQSKIIEKYESLIKGLSKSLFSHKLRFGGFYQNWEMKYGDEIFENISNKNHSSNLPILAITQEHGTIPRDLIDYKIAVTDKSVESYKVVQIGDFVISLRSFQGGIEYSNYKGICSPAYVILRPIIPINNIFYKYYLKTDNYIAELNKNLEGIRDGKMISYKQFSEIPLPYPSIAEQNKIAEILSVINKKAEMEKLLLKRYSEQKKYLLSNLFI